MHSAAASRSTDIIQILLESGADPNTTQNGGWTALHAAAKHGDVAIATLLLEHGADQGIKTEDGTTARAEEKFVSGRCMLRKGITLRPSYDGRRIGRTRTTWI